MNLLGTAVSESANKAFPIAAPITNEVVEFFKGNDKASQIKEETNTFLGEITK